MKEPFFMLQEYKEGDEETEKASKEEYKVGKWIRKNVQVKKTKFLNHNVEYFTSAKGEKLILWHG
jgi:translocation protein SEC62